MAPEFLLFQIINNDLVNIIIDRKEIRGEGFAKLGADTMCILKYTAVD